MLIPIRCFSCNKVVGDKYETYIEEIKKPNKYNKEVLDDLGLNRYCCRRHMITTVDLMRTHINRCKLMTKKYEDKITYVIDSSEKVLASTPEKSIDLLYLPSAVLLRPPSLPLPPVHLLHSLPSLLPSSIFSPSSDSPS